MIYIYIYISISCLKQHFNDCLFQISYYILNFIITYNLFYQSSYIFHFKIVARSILTDTTKQ